MKKDYVTINEVLRDLNAGIIGSAKEAAQILVDKKILSSIV